MFKKTIIIFLLILNLIFMSLIIYYEKEDKRYISTLREKDNISMLKIVGEETEVIKQVPQSGQWSMSYTCDDENAKLYWNEKKRTVVAKNISATECTLIFRENTSAFSLVSMYVNGEYVTKLDENKKYKIESYNCSNGEEVSWDKQNNRISVEPILENTSCDVNFVESKYLTLTEQIIKDNTNASTGKVPADTESNIKFSSVSSASNGQGLYQTGDLTKTENSIQVYYYRGAVENNYLVFGNYCWRIVRTVEDGSVRLRYGGAATQSGDTYTCPQTGTAVNIASSQAYNTSYNDKSYVNYKTSSIRTTVENWYRDNIAPHTSLTNLIADTPYCNDMSERANDSDIYFGAYDRLHSNGTNKYNPQYKCANSTYAYTVAKGDITYPVGLLTADEVAYAGGVWDQSNSSYYLYTGETYWTMSPYSLYGSIARMFNVNSAGHLSYNDVYYTHAVVPVVSLKPEATVAKGTGLYNDPYIILTSGQF